MSVAKTFDVLENTFKDVKGPMLFREDLHSGDSSSTVMHTPIVIATEGSRGSTRRSGTPDELASSSISTKPKIEEVSRTRNIVQG